MRCQNISTTLEHIAIDWNWVRRPETPPCMGSYPNETWVLDSQVVIHITFVAPSLPVSSLCEGGWPAERLLRGRSRRLETTILSRKTCALTPKPKIRYKASRVSHRESKNPHREQSKVIEEGAQGHRASLLSRRMWFTEGSLQVTPTRWQFEGYRRHRWWT